MAATNPPPTASPSEPRYRDRRSGCTLPTLSYTECVRSSPNTRGRSGGCRSHWQLIHRSMCWNQRCLESKRRIRSIHRKKRTEWKSRRELNRKRRTSEKLYVRHVLFRSHLVSLCLQFSHLILDHSGPLLVHVTVQGQLLHLEAKRLFLIHKLKRNKK